MRCGGRGRAHLGRGMHYWCCEHDRPADRPNATQKEVHTAVHGRGRLSVLEGIPKVGVNGQGIVGAEDELVPLARGLFPREEGG